MQQCQCADTDPLEWPLELMAASDETLALRGLKASHHQQPRQQYSASVAATGLETAAFGLEAAAAAALVVGTAAAVVVGTTKKQNQ